MVCRVAELTTKTIHWHSSMLKSHQGNEAMFHADNKTLYSSVNTSSQYQNPYSQYQQRATPVGDLKHYIDKAQSTTEAKVKFEVLAEIIKEFPVNLELTKFFTELLAEIFGFGNYQGWRLNSLNGRLRNDEILFKEVERFLNPNGHLFQLIEKLNNENVTFDLPSSLLPKHISESVQSGVSSFYKVQRSSMVTGNQILPVPKLNALEYYFFTFFCYMMQPNMRKEPIDWNGDVLYVNLFETYLGYFLPISSVPVQEYRSQMSSERSTLSSSSNGLYSKSSNAQSRGNYGVDMNSIIASTGLRPLRPWTWKSETFVQMFSDLWLACHQKSINSARTVQAQEYYLPSDDQVLMVRIFIKHMHTFLNVKGSAPSNQTAVYAGTNFAGQEEELKGAVVSIIQKKLYQFLKNCFSHWPLGMSFKMVLETWLSYIQPWRYQYEKNLDSSQLYVVTDLSNWNGFIEDNLLFYTVLFRMFMLRASRLDLQFLKDVQFINRVTKVFSQANLAELLQEAEESMFTSSIHSNINQISSTRLGSLYPTLRSPCRGIDLEDAGFQYEPLFDPLYGQQMEALAQHIVNEAEKVNSDHLRRKLKITDKGLMGRIKSFFSGGSGDEDGDHDSKLEECLNTISIQLSCIFKFPPPECSKDSTDFTDGENGRQLPKPFISQQCYEDGRLLPEHKIESNGRVTLTERGRLQILQKLRHFDVRGKAPVDLEPIRSYEIHSLVRWLYRISSGLNHKYKVPMTKAYNRQDIIGKTLRTLSPRVLEHGGTSVRLPSTSAVGKLQPRISLRFLASYYTIYYIVWLLIIAKLFGLGLLQFSTLLLLLFIIFTLQNVVSSPLKTD